MYTCNMCTCQSPYLGTLPHSLVIMLMLIDVPDYCMEPSEDDQYVILLKHNCHAQICSFNDNQHNSVHWPAGSETHCEFHLITP